MGRKDDGGLVAVPLAGANPETARSTIAPSYAPDRPILEVARKWWTGMIITKIMRVIEENNVLCSAQHGSRRNRSTASANLIFKNALESAWESETVVYGSSWDISKAFDSVSKDD